MKRLFGALVCLFIAAGGVQAAQEPALLLHETPKALPEITFADEAGTSMTSDAWRGKVVLLNLWATWCAPCRAEMPTLDQLQAELGGETFEVVALSIDRAGAGVVREFYDEIGIKALRLVVDPSGKAARDLAISGLPVTLLIGADGREFGRLVGPAEWDSPEMLAFFEAFIANSREGK
jgi:thiol-disulfide isomerase/thioredoxin